MSQHLGDLVRITVQTGIAAVRGRRSLHTQQGSRSHLTAGHTVDRVVDIDSNDALATRSSVNRFARTDCGQVAVALIREHHALGTNALHGRSHGASTAVCSLNPVHVNIFIGKYRTAHRRNGDRVTLEPHLFNNLGNQLVNRTVAATRAVVHHVVRDEFRLAEYQVFLFDFYYFCHSLTFY